MVELKKIIAGILDEVSWCIVNIHNNEDLSASQRSNLRNELICRLCDYILHGADDEIFCEFEVWYFSCEFRPSEFFRIFTNSLLLTGLEFLEDNEEDEIEFIVILSGILLSYSERDEFFDMSYLITFFKGREILFFKLLENAFKVSNSIDPVETIGKLVKGTSENPG